MSPEEKARLEIDKQLIACGYVIQDFVDINPRASKGVIVREYPTDTGEVDYLIDDYDNLSVLPIEIKSGKDYQIHSAISAFTSNEEYKVKFGYVFSNERIIKRKDKIIYLPIYYIMFV